MNENDLVVFGSKKLFWINGWKPGKQGEPGRLHPKPGVSKMIKKGCQ